jgi:hypothetical protein
MTTLYQLIYFASLKLSRIIEVVDRMSPNILAEALTLLTCIQVVTVRDFDPATGCPLRGTLRVPQSVQVNAGIVGLSVVSFCILPNSLSTHRNIRH